MSVLRSVLLWSTCLVCGCRSSVELDSVGGGGAGAVGREDGGGGTASFDDDFVCDGTLLCTATVIDCDVSHSCGTNVSAPVAVDLDAARCVLDAFANGGGVVQIVVNDTPEAYHYIYHHLVVADHSVSLKTTGFTDAGIVNYVPQGQTRVSPSDDCLASDDAVELASCLYEVLSGDVLGPGACSCDGFPNCFP